MSEPPRVDAPYAALAPQVDADGNDIDGLRNTNLQAPLGTYTGWNIRKAGFSGRCLRSDRGFYPVLQDQGRTRCCARRGCR